MERQGLREESNPGVPLSTSPFSSSNPYMGPGWNPVPGRPVIRGVILAIIQGAIFIQGAGNDQAEFVPWEERAEDW